jgi:hypothetical protein
MMSKRRGILGSSMSASQTREREAKNAIANESIHRGMMSTAASSLKRAFQFTMPNGDPWRDAFQLLSPEGNHLTYVVFTGFSLIAFAVGLALSQTIGATKYLEDFYVTMPVTDNSTHMFLEPVVQKVSPNVPVVALGSISVGINVLAYFFFSRIPRFMSTKWAGLHVNELGWLHKGLSGPFVLFVALSLAGESNPVIYMLVMVLFFAQCRAWGREEVVLIARLHAASANPPAYGSPTSLASFMNVGEKFDFFTSMAPSAAIIVTILLSYSFTLLQDPDLPIFNHFGVCVSIVYVLLINLNYILYVFGVGYAANYVNANFVGNLIHFIFCLWVYLDFVIGTVTLPE